MAFTLNAEQLPSLEAYLHAQKWIAPDEQVQSASKPGEGNMNYTLRIRTTFRSFILKQSRPYVEKYPQIPAPANRVLIEGQFYERIQHHELLQQFMPEMSHLDPSSNLMMLEDLGESSDYSSLYQAGQMLPSSDLLSLLAFAGSLHNDFTTFTGESPLPNREMRALNAEHIFHYPFLSDNGLDLDQITHGLQTVAAAYQADDALKAQAKRLSEVYLADGPSLLHGDYYPGSWLKTLSGVKVIDPEFCFFGAPEYEIGVLVAHLYMAEQPQELIDLVSVEYRRPAGYNPSLQDAFTGIEVMRRLIGLAQLPLSLDLMGKETLLKLAHHKLMQWAG